MIEYWPQLAIAYGTYLIATSSPGPATLAIMGASMRTGRKSGLALAGGVICGSLIWGTLAAFGLAGLIAEYGAALFYLKIAGGLYLLWLGWKSLKSAAGSQPAHQRTSTVGVIRLRTQFLKGLGIHLTNPKAVFAWSAIITLGLDPGMPAQAPIWILGGCSVMGITIFGGYALLFSTEVMIRLYARAKRTIETILGLVFGVAGIRLLSSAS